MRTLILDLLSTEGTDWDKGKAVLREKPVPSFFSQYV